MAQLPVHSIYNRSDKDIEQHHTNMLKPTDSFNTQCNEAVDALASFLKNQSGFSVAETIKGGSLGKGTAIRGHCDLDLVLILNGYPTVGSFKQQLPLISARVENVIRQWNGMRDFNVAPLVNKGRVICITMNKVRSGITVRLRVDIVPAFTRQEPREMFRDMATLSPDDRSYYSSSLVKLQTGFVITLPSRVKDLIRLVKDWRKTHLRENFGELPKIPKSYVLELIAINVWEESGRPGRFGLDKMLKLVLRKLISPSEINIAWTTYYSQTEINAYSTGTRVYGKPFILDPADPFHNVGADFDWTEISAMAVATFNSPRLRGV